MGFLVSAESVVLRAAAIAMAPPPPPDITQWATDNVVFDDRSPIRGPFRIDRFSFLREIHEVLSPEHPCREVTVRGSAQWGKTVSIIQPTLGCWFSTMPLDALVVHPTTSAASEWVNNKWLPMRRQAPDLVRIFGARATDNRDTMLNQETAARNGSLKVASAQSPADLTGTTRRLVVMDDLSKFEASEKGDPEALAESRASGFEEAKILRVSTPLLAGTCRITRSYERSDQRLYHVPCPHCGNMAPLTWENFLSNLNPERLHAACFNCDACGAVIGHEHKEWMVARGKWIARNPRGDHPGFHLWRALSPLRDWASIAVEYARVKGWTRLEAGSEQADAAPAPEDVRTEQTFWNDVLGLPYQVAAKGPNWEKLRDRAESEDTPALERGVLPAEGFLFCLGIDCQGDRTECHLVAFGRNLRRWTIDYTVIPHHIGSEACRQALDDLLKEIGYWPIDITGCQIPAYDPVSPDGEL